MSWKETCAVEERMRFVMAAEKGEESFAAICRRFGVSRRIGYKWLARFGEDGIAGLLDRSRAPLHHPQGIASDIAGRCLAVRAWKFAAWKLRPAPVTFGAARWMRTVRGVVVRVWTSCGSDQLQLGLRPAALAWSKVGISDSARCSNAPMRDAGSGWVDSQLGTPRSLSASTRASVERKRGTPVGS